MKHALPSRRALLQRTSVLAALVPWGPFGLCAAVPAVATTRFPERALTLVVPNPAGGEADHLARRIAKAMALRLAQPVVIENIGGASGALAAKRVLRAAPDGYTLLFGTTSDVVVTPIGNKALGYAAQDFTPIAKFGATPMTLVARLDLAASSADAVIAMARERPGALTIGTTGEGSLQALAAETLVRAARVELTRIPYRGGAALLQDLVAGRLDVAVAPLPAALRYAEIGKLQVLGTLSLARSPLARHVPSVNEGQALRGVALDIWAGLVGPPGVPKVVVEVLNSAVNALLTDEALNVERARLGDTPAAPASAEDFGQFLRAEEAKFRALQQSAP